MSAAAVLKQAADSLLHRAVDAGDVPGVAAMVCDRDATLYEGAFGTRRLGANKLMTIDSVMWIASMTKPITCTAVMQLVERGRVGLDDDMGRLVPEIASVQVLEGFDAGGAPRLRAPKSPITLRHLLTHTSGYGYGMWNQPIARYMEITGLPAASSCQNAALRLPLLFDPGERWNYGINIEMVGKVIEALSGSKLGAYLQEHVLEPLGMYSTGFRITPSMRKRMVRLHERAADGALTAGDFEVPQEPEFEMGGGGLYSTAADYLALVRMFLNRGTGNGNRVLAADTVQQMCSNHLGERRVAPMRTADASKSNDVEFFPGLAKGWGLGFMINHERAPTGRCAGSLAWAGLSNCYFWIDPLSGIGGVYLTQILPFADVKSLPLYLNFEKQVYGCLFR